MLSVFLLSYGNTRVSLGEIEKSCENTRLSARVLTAFLILPHFHPCFYNSTDTRYMLFSISCCNENAPFEQGH